MDFALTDERQLVRDGAREFAERGIASRARESARADRFDTMVPTP